VTPRPLTHSLPAFISSMCDNMSHDPNTSTHKPMSHAVLKCVVTPLKLNTRQNGGTLPMNRVVFRVNHDDMPLPTQ